MKKLIACLAICLATPASAFAESLLLNCEFVKGTIFDINELYASPPKDFHNQFIRDGLELGIAGLFIAPPTTWHIDHIAKTVVSPEESHKVLLITKSSDSEIEAYSQFGTMFHLNLVNSQLDYSVNIKPNVVAMWEKAHGGTLPASVDYVYTCTPTKGLGG